MYMLCDWFNNGPVYKTGLGPNLSTLRYVKKKTLCIEKNYQDFHWTMYSLFIFNIWMSQQIFNYS